MPAVLYRADVVCPMSRPPIADGGVVVDAARIVAVGPADALRRDAAREHRVAGVLLPGLVNAHTHLEHFDAWTLARSGPLLAWRDAVAGHTAAWSDERWTRSAHRGVLQALRAGTTAVGDVVTRGASVPAAAKAGLVGDSWVEVAHVDVEHADIVLDAVDHALSLPAGNRRVGIAPDSPATLGTGVLQALAALAARRDAPLTVHAAHSQAEVAAVHSGIGPLADDARARGLEFEWLDAPTRLNVVAYLDACGVLRAGTSIVHGVWVDLPEARLLAERRVPVVCAPRSQALLVDTGEAPLERYAEAGTALALGTESPAACPDMDVLAEAAAWRELARTRGLRAWPGGRTLEEQAVRLATSDGAAAMGWAGSAGVLEPGRRADLVGVGIDTTVDGVYADVVEGGAGRQVLTVVAGVRKARRASADEPWPPNEEWKDMSEPVEEHR